MPDARLQRTRTTLPNGYQFGDGKPDRLEDKQTGISVRFVRQFDIRGVFDDRHDWRAWDRNAAERLKRLAESLDEPGYGGGV